MAQLSDTIERFIKELLEGDMQVELRRNELAQHFGCAPSQINYVLATRFSMDHGYLIESRRGGGGYIKIVRMRERSSETLLNTIIDRIGNSISEESAAALIANLMERNIVTRKEALLMRSAVESNALALPVSTKDVLRASVLSNMVIQAFKNAEEGNN